MQSPPFDLIDIVVRAGAGAGKTTELTQRVLQLALKFSKQHQRFPNFVVTTFTRKATQELRERLFKEALKLDQPGLVQFVNQKSQLHISTIHGILSLFLAQYGSLIGMSPDVQFSSSSREANQKKSLLRRLSQKNEDFNRCFQELLENFEISDLIEAMNRYAELKATGQEIEFYSKQQMQTAKMQLLEKFQLLSSQFAKSIRSLEEQKGWLELATYVESYRPGCDLGNYLDNVPATRKSKTTPEVLVEQRNAWKKAIEDLTEWNLSEEYFDRHEQLCTLFKVCAEQFSQALGAQKILSSEISMADLETLSLQLIQEHPQAALAFSEKWDYWLIDEYQDTSPIQVQLIKSLIGSKKSFVVGDPQQSIYLFRGARSEVFTEKESEVKKDKGVLFSKMKNYRSDPELLEFFNEFFTSMSSQFQAMEAKEDSFSSEKVVADFIRVLDKPDSQADEELLATLWKSQQLIQAGAKPEEICVLLRSNKNIQSLAELALKYRIALQVHSSSQFFSLPEIKDALCLLRFIVNCHDNKNLIQLLRSPYFKVDDQNLVDWCADAKKSFWNSFIDKKHAIIEQLTQLLQSAQRQGIGFAWQEAILAKNYFTYAAQKDPSGMREANLWKLIRSLRESERRSGFSYIEFLQNSSASEPGTEDSGELVAVPVIAPQKINVMTVHASKGLQFPHVIVPKAGRASKLDNAEVFMVSEAEKLSDKISWTLSIAYPEDGVKKASVFGKQILQKQRSRSLDEEERVLYVALTRAEKSVSLIWSGQAEANSWIGKSKFFLSEGVQAKEKYSYNHYCGNFSPVEIDLCIENIGLEGSAFKFENVTKKSKSVTELIEQGKSSNSPQPEKMSDISKAVLGVNVHRIFENLQYFWLNNPNLSIEEIIEKTPEEFKAPLQYLAKDSGGRWVELIRDGFVEYGVSIEDSGSLIQGQIDLWGIDKQGTAWIVDYKTGSNIYSEKAFRQLEIYLWCLKKMKKIKPGQPSKLAVIYPYSEQTIVRDSEGWQNKSHPH